MDDVLHFFITDIVFLFVYLLVFFLLKETKKNIKRLLISGYRTKVSLRSRKNWRILNLYYIKYMMILFHTWFCINTLFFILKIIVLNNNTLLKLFLTSSLENFSVILTTTSGFINTAGVVMIVIILKMKEKKLKKHLDSVS